MNAWEAEIARARDAFIHELSKFGIHLDERRSGSTGQPTLTGAIEIDPRENVDVEISLPDGWPYRPCKVTPLRHAGSMSWHQDTDGSLCLWTGAEDYHPWRDASQVVERTRRWFLTDRKGWPDDPPDLDLERYFARVNGPLILYEDIENLVGRVFKARDRGNNTREFIHSGKSAAKRGRKHGFVIDLGDLDRPVHNWVEIADRLGPQAEEVEAHVQRFESSYLLLTYRRGAQRGVVALLATYTGDGHIRLHSLEAASKDDEVLKLRAGLDAAVLAEHAVAIVGLGAVGSHVADMLARAGVQRLVLRDGERLRPGNCIRHLCGLQQVGKQKTTAVRDVLHSAGHLPAGGVELLDAVRVPSEAFALTKTVSLVVDATGNPSVSALLEDASRHTETSCVSVYLQRNGSVARVDRWPLSEQEQPLDPVPPIEDNDGPVLREGGCGEPVSPTPAHAAVAGAGHAVRAATNLLAGRDVPATTIYVLEPQPDYDRGIRT